MMPKISPLHWIALVIFLIFYGLTVFALTRDYYLRQTVAPVAQTAPGQTRASEVANLIPPDLAEMLQETDPARLHQRADAFFMQGRYNEAALLYGRILKLNPEDAEAHNDLGLALHYLGDTQGALEILRAGTAKAPELQRQWLTLGFVQLSAGHSEEARAALERARDLDPQSDVGEEAVRLLSQLGG